MRPHTPPFFTYEKVQLKDAASSYSILLSKMSCVGFFLLTRAERAPGLLPLTLFGLTLIAHHHLRLYSNTLNLHVVSVYRFCIFFSRCETKKFEYEDESLKLAGGESCLLFSMVLLFGVGSTVYGCCYLLTLTFSSPRFHFHQISVLAS